MTWGYSPEQDWYDVMQVCENGHVITAFAQSQPDTKQRFCEQCGKKTIDTCQSCGQQIRGYHHQDGIHNLMGQPAPNHCTNCGSPFAWHIAKIEGLKEVLRQQELDAGELEIAEGAIGDLIYETPKTEASSLQFQRIITKLKKPAYDIVIGIITDVASETTKKILGIG